MPRATYLFCRLLAGWLITVYMAGISPVVEAKVVPAIAIAASLAEVIARVSQPCDPTLPGPVSGGRAGSLWLASAPTRKPSTSATASSTL